jgi:hypothetical protein
MTRPSAFLEHSKKMNVSVSGHLLQQIHLHASADRHNGISPGTLRKMTTQKLKILHSCDEGGIQVMAGQAPSSQIVESLLRTPWVAK